MATLVLGTLGSLVGGPVGGALGALAGRAIDGSLAGWSAREGPRLQELAVTTSTYGNPIPLHYGRVRTAGTVIWATDLAEHSETTGGGKGRPGVTQYSYSASFAVLLCGRPVAALGRIWADGNLLRGAAGDLKAGGVLRFYSGRGDQPVDPLIAADLGAQCPAFRGCAYAVFEDLQLEDFGNRIPALSFELLADEGGAISLPAILGDQIGRVEGTRDLPGLAGFSCAGGTLRDTVALIDRFYPVDMAAQGDGLRIAAGGVPAGQVEELPAPCIDPGATEIGARTGWAQSLATQAGAAPSAIRYYDPARDYQPGIQRITAAAHGDAAASDPVDFPAVLDADNARRLIAESHDRLCWQGGTIEWRIAELDSAHLPGAIVQVPGQAGLWQVVRWEWQDSGVVLNLARLPPPPVVAEGGITDPGTALPPRDAQAGPTLLRAFELPWDGTGSPFGRQVYAAASGTTADWAGCAFYADSDAGLTALGTTTRQQAVQGTLATALPPSPALMFGPESEVDVVLAHAAMQLVPTDMAGIASGANRLLAGAEVLQFRDAVQIGGAHWRLRGLLRGRGGTEAAAQAGVTAGAPFTLIDSRLSMLAGTVPGTAGMIETVAVIGRGDSDAVSAAVENRGLSQAPLSPVHARIAPAGPGQMRLSWVRRARGSWAWPDGVEVPLNEEVERYRIGLGPLDAPLASWEVGEPAITIEVSTLPPFAPASLWVRQLGRAGASPPLWLPPLPD